MRGISILRFRNCILSITNRIPRLALSEPDARHCEISRAWFQACFCATARGKVCHDLFPDARHWAALAPFDFFFSYLTPHTITIIHRNFTKSKSRRAEPSVSHVNALISVSVRMATWWRGIIHPPATRLPRDHVVPTVSTRAKHLLGDFNSFNTGKINTFGLYPNSWAFACGLAWCAIWTLCQL